jgi:bifunctional non-homologous end joining protein LigD
VCSAGIEQGLEGVVAKLLTSRYYPGKRREWIKVKNVRHQEVVVAGWKPGEGSRANMIGSLLVAS